MPVRSVSIALLARARSSGTTILSQFSNVSPCSTSSRLAPKIRSKAGLTYSKASVSAFLIHRRSEEASPKANSCASVSRSRDSASVTAVTSEATPAARRPSAPDTGKLRSMIWRTPPSGRTMR